MPVLCRYSFDIQMIYDQRVMGPAAGVKMGRVGYESSRPGFGSGGNVTSNGTTLRWAASAHDRSPIPQARHQSDSHRGVRGEGRKRQEGRDHVHSDRSRVERPHPAGVADFPPPDREAQRPAPTVIQARIAQRPPRSDHVPQKADETIPNRSNETGRQALQNRGDRQFAPRRILTKPRRIEPGLLFCRSPTPPTPPGPPPFPPRPPPRDLEASSNRRRPKSRVVLRAPLRPAAPPSLVKVFSGLASASPRLRV